MVKTIVGHAVIALSGMYLVFFFIDRVNSAMCFINNDITKRLLLVLCALSMYLAACAIHDRRELRRVQKRAKNDLSEGMEA